MKNLKNGMRIVLELVKFIYEWLAQYPIITTVCCAIILGVHIALNIVYFDKDVPISGMHLYPIIAFLNVLNVGILTGSLTGYCAIKQIKK